MSKRKIDDLYPEMEYFMNEDKSDVVFLVEGKRVPALKQVLSLKSEVFEAMFSEKYKEGKDKEVVIEDTTFNAFETLIRFIYTEQLVLKDKDKDDIQMLAKICRLADRYDVQRLIAKVSDHLKSRINDKNIDLILRIAFDYRNIEKLKEKTIEFFENSFNGDLVFMENLYESLTRLLDSNETIELKDRITIRLNAILSLKNLNLITSFAFGYNFEELQTKVMKFIETNINQLIKRNRNELEALYYATDRQLVDVLLSHHLKPAVRVKELRVGGKTYLIILKLLTPQMKETFNRFNNESMDSVSAQVFEVFIGFAYFNDFEIKDWNNFEFIEEVCDFCEAYEAIEMLDRIGSELKYRISSSNLKRISTLAFDYNLEDLKTKVLKFIETNINELVKKNRNELVAISHSTRNQLLDVLLSHHLKPAVGLKELRVGGKTFLIIWKLLTPQMRETFNRFIKESMDSVSAQVFEIFIGFAYFNDLKIKDWNNFEFIEEVCDFCAKYEAIEMLNRIANHLKYNISLRNLKRISKIAFKYKNESFMIKVRKFIDQNFQQIIVENIEDLKEINRLTDDSLLEVFIKRQN